MSCKQLKGGADIKVDNLKIGQVAKNYKELCSILEIKVEAGNSKKSQLKELERFINYHKEGNKFVIDEIFEKIKEKERSKDIILSNINRGNYSKEMFPLVKDFVGINDWDVYFSKSYMMNSLKLKNKNYDMAYQYPQKTSKVISLKLNIDIDENDIKSILTSMWSISQDKIKSAFENLEKLNYIHSYDDKLLCIFNADSKRQEVVLEEDMEGFTKCIYEGKLSALAEYFSKNPKKTMSEYIDLVNCIQEGLNTDLHEDRLKVSTKLNQELYLRGLGEKGRTESLNMLHRSGYTYVKNFYYAYSYLKDEEIEWDSEILDMAKKQIHIEGFKRAVKNDYILDTFLDKWFDEENKKIDDYKYPESQKRKFKTELKKHKVAMTEKYNYLFEILVSDNTPIDLASLFKEYNKIDEFTEDTGNVIPF